MQYSIIRALNNNAVLAHSVEGPEVILMGKGIGFGHRGSITSDLVERSYILSDYREKSAYLNLLEQGDPDVFETVSDIILMARETLGELHPSIFPVLSGHVDFAAKRVRQGMRIENPLLPEIKSLYQEEYEVALAAVNHLNKKLGIKLLAEEAGYIALHLGAARTNQDIKFALRLTNAVNNAMDMVERGLKIRLESGPLYRQTVELLKALTREEKTKGLENVLLADIRRRLPEELRLAQDISSKLSGDLGCKISEQENGFFAIHLYYLKVMA